MQALQESIGDTLSELTKYRAARTDKSVLPPTRTHLAQCVQRMVVSLSCVASELGVNEDGTYDSVIQDKINALVEVNQKVKKLQAEVIEELNTPLSHRSTTSSSQSTDGIDTLPAESALFGKREVPIGSAEDRKIKQLARLQKKQQKKIK